MSPAEAKSAAARDACREYAMAILRTTDAMDPTLAEIEEIGSHCIMLNVAYRQWKKNEAIVIALRSLLGLGNADALEAAKSP